MSYLIDTNVLSELRRKSPHPDVVAWMRQRRPDSLYISVLTLGELRKGIETLADGDKKLQLRDWLENDLPVFFRGRVLLIDAAVAQRWGCLQAEMGRPIPAVDSLLAAQALHAGMKLVTRNVKDFAYPGLEVINPWSG
ncbi:MAG: type II toxin-antitoxin system VapC family toxin [Pseudomonadota bacterium]|nr:type II toxin-antitoxin system VapC family toxin [Pseudomonadota bacterium]MDP1904592.1 type II toxin-antitoxin system VapC family toxin [Pseudomonadota bacterium]MDP2353209.1 type II toxin-antitoxin system VapC family toxin [Pseudomonadota bacterium]MDP2433754.1 type II toxin-antitoxin system VapC family toxin [Pseudomonadota bacterium]